MNTLREARIQAGITQEELSSRTGIAVPNLSAYESGRRRPSEETRVRIEAACRRRPSELVAQRRDEILAIIEQYGGLSVSVFGSAARRDDRWNSDLDLLVDMAPETGVFDLVRMWTALEEALDVPVDLVDREAIADEHSAFAEQIVREAVPL